MKKNLLLALILFYSCNKTVHTQPEQQAAQKTQQEILMDLPVPETPIMREVKKFIQTTALPKYYTSPGRIPDTSYWMISTIIDGVVIKQNPLFNRKYNFGESSTNQVRTSRLFEFFQWNYCPQQYQFNSFTADKVTFITGDTSMVWYKAPMQWSETFGTMSPNQTWSPIRTPKNIVINFKPR